MAATTPLRVSFRTVKPEFREIVRRALARFPSQKALAKELQISSTRLSHVLNPKPGIDDYPFNIGNCLRLAKAANESPLVVLRAAGQGEEADLIQFFYGESELTPAQRDLLKRWKQLETDDHAAIWALIERFELLHRLRSQGRTGDPQSHEAPRETRAKAVGGRRRRVGGG